MLEDQHNHCAICGTTNGMGNGVANPKNITLAVDHCHITGKIRGLLCNLCNRALGLFQDNIMNLEMAITYLEISTKEQHEN